jgi:hypothetical protein
MIWNRQELRRDQARSRELHALAGFGGACSEAGKAACDISNSTASLTSRAARRLLAIFRTPFSFALTMYALPILTIE